MNVSAPDEIRNSMFLLMLSWRHRGQTPTVTHQSLLNYNKILPLMKRNPGHASIYTQGIRRLQPRHIHIQSSFAIVIFLNLINQDVPFINIFVNIFCFETTNYPLTKIWTSLMELSQIQIIYNLSTHGVQRKSF